MSLSKLRRCKALLLSIGVELDLELSTIALACVYLERLCWRNVLDKKNRRLASAACLILAFKWNEAVQHSVKHKQTNQLFAVRSTLRHSTVSPTHRTICHTMPTVCREWLLLRSHLSHSLRAVSMSRVCRV